MSLCGPLAREQDLCAGAEQQDDDVDETPEANRAKGFSEDPVSQVMGIEWRQETRFAHRRVAGLRNRTRLLMASPRRSRCAAPR